MNLALEFLLKVTLRLSAVDSSRLLLRHKQINKPPNTMNSTERETMRIITAVFCIPDSNDPHNFISRILVCETEREGNMTKIRVLSYKNLKNQIKYIRVGS